MSEDFDVFLVDDHRRPQAIETLVATRGSFAELAAVLGLDKRVDFQGSDLRGVDFTGSDLRGYDFTGADLRGSYGVGVAMDETTRLDGADVASSPFGHTMFERAVVNRNARFERDYGLLRDAYWADQLPSVLAMIKASDDPADARLMAMRLFTDAKDAVVRADMVRVLAVKGLDHDEYSAFLLNVCATRSEPAVLVAAIDVMAALYRDRKPVFDTFLALTSHRNEQVQVAAFEGLARSRHFALSRNAVSRRLAAGVSPLARRALARRLAPTIVPHGGAIMDHEPFARAIAMNQRVTADVFDDVGFHVARSDRAKREAVSAEARRIVAALVEAGLDIAH